MLGHDDQPGSTGECDDQVRLVAGTSWAADRDPLLAVAAVIGVPDVWDGNLLWRVRRLIAKECVGAAA